MEHRQQKYSEDAKCACDDFVETINPISVDQLELPWDEETQWELENDRKMSGMAMKIIDEEYDKSSNIVTCLKIKKSVV